MKNSKIALKQPVVQEIAELFDGAKSAVVVDYRGLTVEQDTQLRRSLREAGVTYKVYKNTMVRIASKGTDFEKLDDLLEGPTAIAVSKEDATAPARVLAEFAKNAPILEIKGGLVEGEKYDATAIQAIASIPSREVLLGRLLGSMKSPISNLARVLNQIAEKKGEPAATAEAAE
jgi:large subunit ribosomal protein L10